MNGARSLIQSLLNAGVDVCFANPGTSEMHLVQAMDAEPAFRGVLCLFEGVCTGAADGYARIAGKPAVTLLHLGPGLGNGIANLHNARRAASPIINLVGNHTRDHEALDAPLTSDIVTLAQNVSSWIKTDSTAESLAADGLAALAAVMQKAPGSKGQIATLIMPADACWGPASRMAPNVPITPVTAKTNADFAQIAARLTAGSLILLDKDGLLPAAREAAAKIANAHDFIVQMEQGYQTSIGDRGNKLSGGQRQRISIARALLAKPKIVILDEATSNLDTQSEAFIQKSLAVLMRNRTTFVIAHRLSTIQKADQILVIEEGDIVERGKHEELLKTKGRYHELYTYQTRM